MEPDATVGAPAGTTWLQVEDRVVVATPTASRPIVLDPVSSSVWSVLAAGSGESAVIAALVEIHGIDAADAAEFAGSLLEQLHLGGFLEAADFASSTNPGTDSGTDSGFEPSDEIGPVQGRRRRFHATCAPCDTSPLLKGPTTILELCVGGVGVTVLVLDRTGLVEHLEQWQIQESEPTDPLDLFVLGRIPRDGSFGLFDHYGVLLARAGRDHAIELAELLVGDLEGQPEHGTSLRGVAVTVGGGVVVVHERWRALAIAAAADGSAPAPSPTSVLGLEWGIGGASVTFRSAEAPHEVRRAPLLALGVPEAPSDRASSVALAATVLRDPGALTLAARVADEVALVALPVDGDVGTFAAWLTSGDPGGRS